MDYKTLKNNHEERSEAEHKKLITTANNGLKAIEILINKYPEFTEIKTIHNDTYKLNIKNLETTDIIREK